MTRASLAIAMGCGALACVACGDLTDNIVSDYAGQEQRSIKSLSADDIRQLETGGGWGLAKAAELNGVPGPKHILEMKERISLSADQESSVSASYERMREEAVPLGKKLVALERQLNDAFADDTITEDVLNELLGSIAETSRALRYVHLAAHLEMRDILSKEQIAHYNQLRGYGQADPCEHIPEGHDPEMWREHNDCN